MTSAISLLVGKWKIYHSYPEYSFIHNVQVVYFTVKHSYLCNNYEYIDLKQIYCQSLRVTIDPDKRTCVKQEQVSWYQGVSVKQMKVHEIYILVQGHLCCVLYTLVYSYKRPSEADPQQIRIFFVRVTEDRCFQEGDGNRLQGVIWPLVEPINCCTVN